MTTGRHKAMTDPMPMPRVVVQDEYPEIPRQSVSPRSLVGALVAAVLGAAATYGVTVTFSPTKAEARQGSAPVTTEVIQPKVQMLSESQVMLISEHAAESATEKMATRMNDQRKEDFERINQQRKDDFERLNGRLDTMLTAIQDATRRPR